MATLVDLAGPRWVLKIISERQKSDSRIKSDFIYFLHGGNLMFHLTFSLIAQVDLQLDDELSSVLLDDAKIRSARLMAGW